jgi:hypothetical protein
MDENVPSDPESLKRFVTDVLQALDIPQDTTWHATWEHGGGGIATENVRNPTALY